MPKFYASRLRALTRKRLNFTSCFYWTVVGFHRWNRETLEGQLNLCLADRLNEPTIT
jgi:hypothetical protein